MTELSDGSSEKKHHRPSSRVFFIILAIIIVLMVAFMVLRPNPSGKPPGNGTSPSAPSSSQ